MTKTHIWTRTLARLELCLRALCYLILAFAVVGALGGSSCYVVTCDDDYYDDDDDDFDHVVDDDDNYCNDDDDDDDFVTNSANQDGATAGAGGGLAVEALIEAGTRLVLPALRTRTSLVPRWSARASLPRLAAFESVAAAPGGPLRFEALTDPRGIGPFGPVALGPVGAELSQADLVEFAALFLSLNADLLGLPDGLGPWEHISIDEEGPDTHVRFTATMPASEGGAVFVDLKFDGFGVLVSVRLKHSE